MSKILPSEVSIGNSFTGALFAERTIYSDRRKLPVPEYWLRFDRKDDQLAVYPCSDKGGLRQITDVLRMK